MQHDKNLTLQKVENRLGLIKPLCIRDRSPIENFRYKKHEDEPKNVLEDAELDDSSWTVIKPETYWGEWNINFTLLGGFTVPADWKGRGPVALELSLGETPGWDFAHPEALVYIDGKPLAAADRNHNLILLNEEHVDGNRHQLTLPGYTGRWCIYDHIPKKKLFMGTNSVALIDQPTRDFVASARVAIESAKRLPKESTARAKIIHGLDLAFQRLETMHPLADAFYASVKPAHDVLQKELGKAGQPLDVTVHAVGHSHIDVAWVWPLAQTRLKCGRTFHTALSLMDEFGEYCFTQSQPQLYEYVREDYPELFDRIREKVKDGRWEILGGMWVEADCNLSGGESLARQFLLGRRFFAEHFGPEAESPVLWLPDVFGYCGNLPQLIKQAGLDYFFTTKLSWNQYNKMPFDTFEWQGLDGTRVLTHLSTTRNRIEECGSTYIGEITPNQIYNTWASAETKGVHADLMTCYGFSDGGGGPTREMIENIRELKAFPGMPKVKTSSCIEFFKALKNNVGEQAPVWNGELYLEYHRGTYTSQAKNKRSNRKSEFGLHNSEFLNVLAGLVEKKYDYPQKTINKAWEMVCLNQFHDIIPGSSIPEVYADSDADYKKLGEMIEETKAQAIKPLARAAGGSVILINPNSFFQTDPIEIDFHLRKNKKLQTLDGVDVIAVTLGNGRILIVPPKLSPYSITPLILVDGVPDEMEQGLSADTRRLENSFVRVTFNTEGDIISFYDKINQRETIPHGCVSNQMLAYEDRPLNWDAWDIDIFYDDKEFTAEPARSMKIVENTSIRVVLEMDRTILNSPYRQRITLYSNSPRLDIETTIDWKERFALLKAAFPVDVLSPRATFEVQWGLVERPTHQNTSWDWARFESCAHKWIDLSERNYGVSLLNDCKYGHDVKENTMRITLLRGPIMPDPNCDLGEHTFTYSLLPHSGPLSPETIRNAYALNNPAIGLANDSPAEAVAFGLAATNRDNVVIETIKRAEDSDAVIIRLFESVGCRGPVELELGFDAKSCRVVNLLEEEQETLEVDGRRIQFNITPFKIITLLIELSGG